MDAQSAGQSPQQHNGIDVNEKAKHHPSRLVNNSAQTSKSVPPPLHSSYAFFDDYVADTVTAVPLALPHMSTCHGCCGITHLANAATLCGEFDLDPTQHWRRRARAT